MLRVCNRSNPIVRRALDLRAVYRRKSVLLKPQGSKMIWEWFEPLFLSIPTLWAV